ncbi:MAG: N-acetylmuramoyl-L-alanine amidase [Marmoricola sp.]
MSRSTDSRVDDPTVLELPVPIAASSKGATRILRARHTPKFGLVGVTWALGAQPSRVQIKYLRHHQWSHWRTLRAEDSSGPRLGTDPVWIGKATGITVRISGKVRDARVVLVDPGKDLSPSSRLATARVDGASAYTPLPDYVSRGAWGARAPTNCDQPRLADHLEGVIFHHTAGSNRYARSTSARIVRGIQAYHMSGRGWCDIGYNFLVDKYGQVFEGRAGGVLPQVRGAHAGNFAVNTYATGISMMGNLDRVRPTDAMKAAAVRLIGWRLATNYLGATGSYSVDGHSLPRIAGHRQVHMAGFNPSTATACPGRYAYSWLPSLRSRVATYISNYSTLIRSRAEEMGVSVTGRVRIGEYPTSGGFKTVFGNGTMYSRSAAYWVSGAMLAAYSTYGEESGALGFPISDETATDTGSVQEFEHGSSDVRRLHRARHPELTSDEIPRRY